MATPASELQRYRAFIDGLVTFQGSMFYLASLAERGESPKGAEFAELFQHFSPDQFQVLSKFITNLRSTAFHDFLVFLHDSGYTLSHDGKSILPSPSDNPPYADFIGREDGTPWEDLQWTSLPNPEPSTGNT